MQRVQQIGAAFPQSCSLGPVEMVANTHLKTSEISAPHPRPLTLTKNCQENLSLTMAVTLRQRHQHVLQRPQHAPRLPHRHLRQP